MNMNNKPRWARIAQNGICKGDIWRDTKLALEWLPPQPPLPFSELEEAIKSWAVGRWRIPSMEDFEQLLEDDALPPKLEWEGSLWTSDPHHPTVPISGEMMVACFRHNNQSSFVIRQATHPTNFMLVRNSHEILNVRYENR